MTLRLNGTSSGFTEIDAPAAAGSNKITLPTSNGSAEQFLKNSGTAGELEFSSMVETSTGVGIGTSPTTPLQVHSSTTASTIRITNSTCGATSSDGLIIQESGNDTYIWNKENSFISLGTNNTDRLRITKDGNVAIGTTGPFGGNVTNRRHFTLNGTDSAMFQWGVNGTDRGYLYADATNLSIINTQNGYLRLNTNDTERVRIFNDGNIAFDGRGEISSSSSQKKKRRIVDFN